MKSSSAIRLQIYTPAPRRTNTTSNCPLPFSSFKPPLPAPSTRLTTVIPRQILVCYRKTSYVMTEKPAKRELARHVSSGDHSRFIIVGAISIAMALFLMGADDHQKAMALGPEGPLMEEFWENVRRYALYALTVSTGAIYTIFQPIVELLKNPISAILILMIIGGSIYIVSQVLSAMVGVSDFTYNYGY